MAEHYKQRNAYGCGLYSLANALQDSDLITDERIEKSKRGNNIGQLSLWLQESGYECWIEALRYDNGEKIELFDLTPDFSLDKSVLWFPFMVVFQSTKEKNHMIGCRYMRNGTIVVHDSLLDSEIIHKNFDKFKEYYEKEETIVSYEILRDFEYKEISVIEL